MVRSEWRDYYKEVRRAATVVNSEIALEQVLNAIVKGTARAMNAGASLVLLDSDRKKLIHSYSWRLPKSYLRKGVLAKSNAQFVEMATDLAERLERQVVGASEARKILGIKDPG